ncbi:glycosyltransferase family 4 protein [Rudaeicoccus suwonensis]|uniref:Glycosyltransferase involved in cell wall biosynthesis n=1 Tax=Rudaeicoccus suwonensis TaxID=657409 RepID=A0A561E3K5_9MICO|nr:glycosyltransferase family 4 protein [Rudaeicoccus suwonensis]TWE10188.1 glycosyltransferase involved in cell wall biosynthesis [Rudaeicoccus suwonensis]
MRVALASYRSKPHSGGQGVYVRNLSRELVAIGHQVEVFSGPPYPVLDPGVRMTKVESLDLYREPDPFRRPGLREFRSAVDVLEFATMCTAGYPEPRTFGMRLHRLLRDRIADFDILHDNQTLAPGILALERAGMPLLTTIHHPISKDRRLELEAATGWGRLTKRRWYDFVRMQARVARSSRHVLTVSEVSAHDIAADFRVPRQRVRVVPVGVDVQRFCPPTVARVPGRLVTITSADVPLKGMSVLIDALARLDRCAWSELVVVGSPSEKTDKRLAEAGILDRVSFRSGLSDEDLAALIGSAQVQVIPSLYEGFSIPAVEAMACATPVVATRVGALPDLLAGGVGRLVAPGDATALADALTEVLASDQECARMGAAGRQRAATTYSWTAVAQATAQIYADVIADRAAGALSRN